MLPLTALRAFEAAARLGSFTKAAAELAMTQAAVSYQVKQLESRLDMKLFRRAGRSVALTPAGSRLAGDVLDAFAHLRGACARASEEARGRLTITALPTVASHWLVPRLDDFQRSFPQYALQLDTSVELQDLRTGAFDVAIRTGAGNWPGCTAKRLFPNRYSIVCHPDLVAGGKLTSPADLLRLPLFGREAWWRSWLELAGLPHADLRVTELGTQPSEVTAALAQGGAAVVTPLFFLDDLNEGRLVKPFDIVAPGRSWYWLIYPSASHRSPKIQHFERWIIGQASKAA